jgi:Apoptosis inhibitory protein 5 (API5)
VKTPFCWTKFAHFVFVQIRRLAIKELPSFCKDLKENTPKISDILAQLLNATDPMEVQQVNISLQALSKVKTFIPRLPIF